MEEKEERERNPGDGEESGDGERERKRGHCKEYNPSETSRTYGTLGFRLHKECAMYSSFLFFLFLILKERVTSQEKDLGTDIPSRHLDCITSFL